MKFVLFGEFKYYILTMQFIIKNKYLTSNNEYRDKIVIDAIAMTRLNSDVVYAKVIMGSIRIIR